MCFEAASPTPRAVCRKSAGNRTMHAEALFPGHVVSGAEQACHLHWDRKGQRATGGLDGLDDADGVLCLDVWRHLFGNPSVAAEAWTTFLEGPIEEARQNAGRRAVPYNRVVGWAMPPVTVAVGGPPG